MTDEVSVNIGAAFKAAREEAGLRQSDFAKKADLDPSYVSMLENNRKSPTLTVYFRICEVLKLRPSELMKRIENLPSSPVKTPAPPKKK